MIFLCVRSPEAPKMTSAHGSGVRRRARPSASGFSCCVWAGCSAVSVTLLCSLLWALLEVAAEAPAHRGEDAVAPLRLAARGEAVEQRGCEHGGRDSLLDRGLNGPSSLAGLAHAPR